MYIEVKIKIKKFKQYSDIFLYRENIENDIKTDLFLRGYKTEKIDLGYIPVLMYNVSADEYEYTYKITIKKINENAEPLSLKEGEIIKRTDVSQNGAGWFFVILATAIIGVVAVEVTTIQVIKVIADNADKLEKVNKSSVPVILGITLFTSVIVGGIIFFKIKG